MLSIPIEERPAREITHQWGRDADGALAEIAVSPDGSPVGNLAFDVTPAWLVTRLITERGLCAAERVSIAALFADLADDAAA